MICFFLFTNNLNNSNLFIIKIKINFQDFSKTKAFKEFYKVTAQFSTFG